MEAQSQQVLILVASGPSTPARCAAPFHIATLLACMDAQVTLFLTGEAVRLAQQNIANTLRATEDGEPLLHFIRQAKDAGARLLMCRQPGVPLDKSALIAELDEISSGGELAQLILEAERVLTL
ncbi:DsrE family protein [Pseudomonas sp.]|jgi:predicted peroxiredoxin|uniref:DsrE family protein n=1 Tax=Pseudomonas sp. TaxID=306 RepID=UPI0019FC69EA|nr:DsrE family protein [Pseudomonas sp.]MBF0675292.1 DsrE family protein [Pseudomonas sp.]